MSRKPTNAAAEPPGTPSDLELMLYADGELPEERIAEVEAYLDRSASARNKLRGLDLVSTLIREDALDRAAQAGDLTDAIFARIQAEAPAVAPAPAPKLATVHPLPVAARVPGAKAKPANDGSRAIFTLAAVAFAAAAGLMIWGKARIAQDPQAHLRPLPVQTAPARAELPAPPPAKSAEIAEGGDDEHGVEVATVNFGSRSGSIFYVPKGAAPSNATTTVVWLNDDAAGGE